jgi:hypothetical protein
MPDLIRHPENHAPGPPDKLGNSYHDGVTLSVGGQCEAFFPFAASGRTKSAYRFEYWRDKMNLRPWWRLAVYFLVLCLISEVSMIVYTKNQIAGLYQPDGDSIAIPIYSTLLTMLVSAIPLSILSFLLQAKYLSKLLSRSRWQQILVGAVIFGLYGFGILFALGGSVSVLDQNHYPIGASHILLLAVMCWLAYFDVRWLLSSKKFREYAQSDGQQKNEI